MLVDEIDLLQTRTQSVCTHDRRALTQVVDQVLYNIFDWPNQRNSRLIVVAAGNQIDLLGYEWDTHRYLIYLPQPQQASWIQVGDKESTL